MKRTITILIIVALPMPAAATLISIDDATWGPDSITLDTDTRIEWPDVANLFLECCDGEDNATASRAQTRTE